MNVVKITIATVSLLALAGGFASVYAQAFPPTELQLPTSPIQTTSEFVTLVQAITNWIFAFFALLAVVFVLLAGWQFVSSSGEPAVVSQARMKLIYAAIGIGVALLAQGVVPVVKNIVGG